MKIRPIIFFILLSAAVQIIGLTVDFPWKGITLWTLSVIFLLMAAYFTRSAAKN
ncbi:hypothetical protein P4534_19705 [Peribacillus butanolivorans]|uniref:hypothetical protein n=1 Tax=Peribacillus butanolivorans TaxID=421767 RepID=UPI002E228D81|nr:hypothetical protein [Peribacillus butanolivorans]